MTAPDRLHTAAALAQQTQTPCDIAEDGVCEVIDCCRTELRRLHAENAALRAALAQQDEPKGGGKLPPPLQAEPVLVVEKEPDYMSRGHFYEGSKPFIDPTLVWKLPIGTKLYTAPPRRKWRGLSDTEVLSIHQSLCNTVGSDYRTVARAVEAALKEKNNG